MSSQSANQIRELDRLRLHNALRRFYIFAATVPRALSRINGSMHAEVNELLLQECSSEEIGDVEEEEQEQDEFFKVPVLQAYSSSMNAVITQAVRTHKHSIHSHDMFVRMPCILCAIEAS